jgi:crossover junction endonuclease MUS81
MKFKIDIREKTLITILKTLINQYNVNIELEIINLPLGDIIFYDEVQQKDILMIERKKISDLACSIKDGRYVEQSMRLTNEPLHNHNIIYLIEGNMDEYNSKYTRVTTSALYSSMFSLQYYKGFSVIRSFDIQETAEILIRYYLKLLKEKNKECYYNNENNQQSQQTIQDYTKVIKKVKKDNIRPENIGGIILSQIPGISSTISEVVMDKYGSLYDLMMTLKDNPNCMNNLTYKTKNGQERRISHKAISSIKEYLLYKKSNIITIET